MSTEDIIAALASSHPADLVKIRRYVAWIRLRRQIDRHFYIRAHWVDAPARVHWI